MIRTKAEIINSLGVNPRSLIDFPEEAINRMAIQHAAVNIFALAGDYVNPFHSTPAQLESAVNALLDCEERLMDIGSGNDD